jgi:hypothetical protein
MTGDFDIAFDAATSELSGQSPVGEEESAPSQPQIAEYGTEVAAAPSPAEFEWHKDWNKETRESLQELLKQPEGRKYLETFHKQYGSLDERFRDTQSKHDRYHAQLQQLAPSIAPFQQYFQMRGVPPQQAIAQSLAWAQNLYNDPERAYAQLGRELGITTGGGQQQTDQDVWVDPAISQLEQRLMARLEQAEEQLQQVNGTFEGMTTNQILGHIHAFRQAVDEQGNPKAPYFDELMPEITRMVHAGYPLDEAYRVAAYADKQVWGKLEADRAKANEAKVRKEAADRLAEAQKAERATGSKSPPGNGQGGGPAKPRNSQEAFNAAWEKGKAAANR